MRLVRRYKTIAEPLSNIDRFNTDLNSAINEGWSDPSDDVPKVFTSEGREPWIVARLIKFFKEEDKT